MCQTRIIGLVVAALGVGILIGGILPSWLVIWLLGMALIAAGVLLMR